ncbi:hypothetical protein MVEN_00986500 [Mycena venus]|uniref:Uncharacterized protein n=1 Tax=Mycena venus TaxID=2733690 RepID=A0A8H7CZN5_9AGAR|nr:hypothetical protein MVEN_00986500 [Mycena venus]
MILDKNVNGDAPPAYEASLAPVPSTSGPAIPDAQRVDAKRVAGLSGLGSLSLLVSAKTPPVAAPWFFTSSTTRQVRTTVLGIVRDLVKLQPTDQSTVAISILKSCVDACAANGLSIATILQEKSVEGHTPLYWAIIKRPASTESQDENLDLLTALLALSTPLNPATVSDIRLACLLMSDQALFQQLRTSPEFAPMSATDQMLLDATMPPDEIFVEDVPGDLGAFAVDFEIVRFQKRMQVSNAVVLEFIARGRMWRLSFNVSTHDRIHHAPRGTWYAALSLLEQSPPTWVDSRLLVSAPEPDMKQQLSGPLGMFGGKPRPRPTLSVRIKAKEQLWARRGGRGNEIIVPLDGSEANGGMGVLQYAGCPYISAGRNAARETGGSPRQATGRVYRLLVVKRCYSDQNRFPDSCSLQFIGLFLERWYVHGNAL